MTLPRAAWREHPGLARIMRALDHDGAPPRVVGGAVRDTLLGRAVSDIDLATPIKPEEVMRRLETADIKAIPTGIAHGTITALAEGRHFEITTLRRDVSTDGRRATIAFSDDWREDAARRDFTINALYSDPSSGEIFDYFDGIADLEAKRVRFIGEADERIAEDHLRILRYFRFLARFGGETLDERAYAACRRGANSLMALSRERIADELLKLLALPDPRFAVKAMIEGAIFEPFLPDRLPDAGGRLTRLLKREEAHDIAPSSIRRLLALLPADRAIADRIGARLKFSRRMRAELAGRIAIGAVAPDAIRAAAYRHDIETARDAALLYAGDDALAACLEQLRDWQPPRFPLKGGELIAMGVTAGPEVSTLLQDIEREWIGEGFPGEDRVRQIARDRITRRA